jgi:hypothetical protein
MSARRVNAHAQRERSDRRLGTAWLVAVTAAALAGCATASGPSPSATAVAVRSEAVSALQGARTVWIAGAVSRTGGLASGSSGPDSAAVVDSTDVRAELVSAVRKQRGLELAAARDQADLVLYFEQADRLRCGGCRQPEDLWYWWGLVLDPSGRELASLHGETAEGPPAAARRFVESVKAMAHHSRHGG